MITDACGDVSREAHDMAVQRMIQRGLDRRPWVQCLLELQRDWVRRETSDAVCNAAERYGAFGLVIDYR